MSVTAGLRSLLAPERVLTRPLDLAAYASDASFYTLTPAAVVRPVDTKEIKALFDWSRKERVPLTFRGFQADDYVLCFVRDRLYRVETVVRLPKDVPADTFSHWCDEWLNGLTKVDRDDDRCEGRDNDTTLLAGMTYDTEIAGPLVTVVVVDQPTRELLEQRKTPQP